MPSRAANTGSSDGQRAAGLTTRPRADLVRDVLAAKQRHHGAGHSRDQFFLALLRRKSLRVANSDGSAGLEDRCPKQKIIASSRRDEVGLEFDGQNRRIV